jgi:hypothetical protein
MRERLVRVPAVYLHSAEGSVLAFLLFCKINNLRQLNGSYGFDPRPADSVSFGAERPSGG